MTDPAARYEVKVSPVLSAGVYKDSSGNYYELVITYTPSDDDPTICEKFVLPAGTNFAGLLHELYSLADESLRDYVDEDEDVADLLNRIEKDVQRATRNVRRAMRKRRKNT